jgi:hypothetical protein
MNDFNLMLKKASEEMNISKPVVLFLNKDSRHARAMQDAISQGAVPAQPWCRGNSSQSHLIADHDAARLLGQHGDKAGEAIAAKLIGDATTYDFRHIGVLPTRIEMFGNTEGEEVYCAHAEFDKVELADEATLATQLASLVTRGRHVGKVLTDGDLAECLHSVFIDKPSAVAGAISALRQEGSGKEQQLLRVLKTQPQLKYLAKPVEAELKCQ